MSGTFVGLYLDQKRIHLAEIHSQFGEARLTRWVSQEIGAETLSDPAQLGDSLKAALQKSGIKPGAVRFVLPDQESLVRYFDMPLLPKREWSAAVRFEAQKYVPFDIQSLYSEYLAVPDRSAKRLSVMFVAAKKRSFETLLPGLRAAGLRPKVLDAPLAAFARVIARKQPVKGTHVVVDISGDGTLQILILQGVIVLMTRRATLQRGAAGSGTERPGPNFTALLAEIRLALNYFSKNFKAFRIDQVTLCADLENEYRGLGKFVQQEFEVPVRALNPLDHFAKGIGYSSGLLVAVGAALWDMHKGSEKVNLLSSARTAAVSAPMSPADEKTFLQKVAIFTIAAVAAVVFAVSRFMSSQLAGHSAELERITLSTAQAAGGTATSDQLKAQITEITKKKDFLKNLMDERSYLTDKLNQVARLTPEEIRLSVIDFSDSEELNGVGRLSLRIEGFVIATTEAGNELSEVNRLVSTLLGDKDFMKGLDEIRITSVQKLVIDGQPTLKFALDAYTRQQRRG